MTELLESRTLLSVTTVGTAAGTVLYQYSLPDGTPVQVPLADWTVYDDVAQTGTYAAGDPVAVTNLQGQYSLPLVGSSQTVRLLPRSGWTFTPGASQSLTASPGAALGPFTETMIAPTVIDVQAGYTALAAQASGPGGAGIDTTIDDMFAYANQVQANSDTNIRLNLVGTVESNYSESGSFSTDLSMLARGSIADVAAARTANHADVTVLFEGNTDLTNGGEVGTAYEFNRFRPDRAQGDAIVGLLGDLPRDSVTLAHEMGHVLGADHDPAHVVDTLSAPFARGYEFIGDDGVAYQDVMSYGSGTFLPYYSTPAAFYAGHVLGTVNNGDNSRAVRDNGPTVARYAITGGEGPAAAPAESNLVESVTLGQPGHAILGSARTLAYVTLTNVGPSTDMTSATLTLSLAGDTAAAGDPTLATDAVTLRLGLGQSRRIALPITWPTGLASGSYDIVATAASAGYFALSSDASGPAASAAVSYLQPSIDLSAIPAAASLRALPGKTLAVPLRIRNAGNTAAVATVSFSATLASTGVGPIALTVPPRRVVVPAGATRPLALAIKLPSALAPGSYVLSIQLSDTTTPADLDVLDKSVSIQLILL